jgi:uncharacterized protein
VKNTRQLIVWLVTIGLLTGLYACFSRSGETTTEGIDPATYRKSVTVERTKKDTFFRTGTDSPIPDKAGFRGLIYWLPDPAYRVTARLEPFADKTQKLVVRLSDGSEEVYEKFAQAVFALNGQACRLLIVKQHDTYSILFRDATSGHETYGGGRYLDLPPADLSETTVLLDFNAAYNPYCVYNHQYACPLPPAENTLPIPIRAGEKYVELSPTALP